MFFRFGAAVVLIVAISLVGIALEKQALSLKRAITLQTYRARQLEERRARLRLESERLGAPQQLLQALPSGLPAADSPRPRLPSQFQRGSVGHPERSPHEP